MNRLTKEQQISLASLLSQKLALDLDAGDTSTLDACATVLVEFPNDVFLEAFKKYVNIERIVKHNLDLNTILEPKFIEINKHFEESKSGVNNEQGKSSDAT